jgi:hypothetical protein
MNSVSPDEIIALINAYEPNSYNVVNIFLDEISQAYDNLSPDQVIILRANLEEILRMILPRRERRHVPVPLDVPIPAPAAVPIPAAVPRPAALVPRPAAVPRPVMADLAPYNPVIQVKAISEKKLNAATPDICSICHDTHPLSLVATIDCCGQHIGRDCFKGWLQTNQRNPTCPCCRHYMPTFVTYRAFNKKNSPKTPAPRKPRGHPFARYDYIDFALETFD